MEKLADYLAEIIQNGVPHVRVKPADDQIVECLFYAGAAAVLEILQQGKTTAELQAHVKSLYREFDEHLNRNKTAYP